VFARAPPVADMFVKLGVAAMPVRNKWAHAASFSKVQRRAIGCLADLAIEFVIVCRNDWLQAAGCKPRVIGITCSAHTGGTMRHGFRSLSAKAEGAYRSYRQSRQHESGLRAGLTVSRQSSGQTGDAQRF
jgi:hypothetical protein